MNGVYELLASAAIGLLILGANWWVLLAEKPAKVPHHRIKRDDRAEELLLLRTEQQRRG